MTQAVFHRWLGGQAVVSKNMARGRGLHLPCGLPDFSYSWASKGRTPLGPHPGRLPVGSLGRLRYHEQQNTLLQLGNEPADAIKAVHDCSLTLTLTSHTAHNMRGSVGGLKFFTPPRRKRASLAPCRAVHSELPLISLAQRGQRNIVLLVVDVLILGHEAW